MNGRVGGCRVPCNDPIRETRWLQECERRCNGEICHRTRKELCPVDREYLHRFLNDVVHVTVSFALLARTSGTLDVRRLLVAAARVLLGFVRVRNVRSNVDRAHYTLC